MDAQFNRDGERLQTALKLLDVKQEERAQLIAEYQRRSELAFAPRTLQLYRGILKDFRAWCDAENFSSEPPVSPLVLAEYIEHLGGRIRSSTIETRLWAIAEYHRANFMVSPTKHRIVEMALRGVKRTYGAATRQTSPMCKKEVLEAVARLGTSRIDTRDKAVLMIASDSWCRASELVAFRVRDMILQEDGSSLLFVARSKTDQYGEGAYAYLSPRGTRAARSWIEMAGLRLDDPILTKSQKEAKVAPIDPATVSRIFKRIMGRKDVSAHSTRIGGVHDAFRIGCDLSSIMVAGRWTSPEMPARYGRKILASQSAAATVCAEFELNGE